MPNTSNLSSRRVLASTAVCTVVAALGLVAGSLPAQASNRPADGSPDVAFNTNIGAVSGYPIQGTDVQKDGKVLFGGLGLHSIGSFTFPDSSAYPGYSNGGLARLNADGTLDQAFMKNLGSGFAGGSVHEIHVLKNGQILVGGLFDDVNGTPSNHLALLNSNGTLVKSFSRNLGTGFNNGSVRSILVQPNGDIIVAGYFSDINGIPSNGLARVRSNGTPVASFSHNYSTATVASYRNVAVQDAQGNILVGEDTTAPNTSCGVSRFKNNGMPDSTFSANICGEVGSLLVQPSGKIVVGQSGITRLNADGSVDGTFADASLRPNTGYVSALVREADGSILAGARVLSPGDVTMEHLNANGLPLSGFDGTAVVDNSPYPDSWVETISLLPNGNAIIGGSFTDIGTTPASNIAKLFIRTRGSAG
jgi:uncharacterized delta-60 repeat protein